MKAPLGNQVTHSGPVDGTGGQDCSAENVCLLGTLSQEIAESSDPVRGAQHQECPWCRPCCAWRPLEVSSLLLCRVEGRKVEAEMGPHYRGWALAMVRGIVERKVGKEGSGEQPVGAGRLTSLCAGDRVMSAVTAPDTGAGPSWFPLGWRLPLSSFQKCWLMPKAHT